MSRIFVKKVGNVMTITGPQRAPVDQAQHPSTKSLVEGCEVVKIRALCGP